MNPPKTILLLTTWLYALYPVLVLYAYNVEEVTVGWAVLPLVLSLALATLLLGAFRLALKNGIMAALAAVLFLTVFWNYGLIYRGLTTLTPLPHQSVMLLLLAFCISLTYLLSKVGDPKTLQNFHTIVLAPILVLIALNLMTVVPVEIRKQASSQRHGNVLPAAKDTASAEEQPNIYLIVLDEFANMQTLKQEWGYDQLTWTEALREKGFFVAKQSQARYSQTDWNVPSLLNIDYPTGPVPQNTFLDYIYDRNALKGTESFRRLEVFNFRKRMNWWNNSFLLRFLQDNGYRIAVLEGVSQHYNQLRFEKADFHFSYQDANTVQTGRFIGAFHLELFRKTALYPIQDFLKIGHDYLSSYYGTQYIFRYLKAGDPVLEQPVFVLAHIMCPHDPFVFDADGHKRFPVYSHDFLENKFVAPGTKANEAYIEQHRYVMSEITEIIERRIRNHAASDPVMIIQSDHGPRPHAVHLKDHTQAFRVFNAVYFPDGDYAALHDSIAPVNVMRVILNKYFGQSYEMVADR